MVLDGNYRGKLDYKFNGPYRILRTEEMNVSIGAGETTVHDNRLKPYFTPAHVSVISFRFLIYLSWDLSCFGW